MKKQQNKKTKAKRKDAKGRVFRHTFCTNMANAGMDLKSLQYLMGHSDVSVTLNVYAHSSYEKAEAEMARIAAFSKKSQSKARKRKA